MGPMYVKLTRFPKRRIAMPRWPYILAFLTICSVAQAFPVEGTKGTKLIAAHIATFNEAWAMTFLPNGSLLVTQKNGKLFIVSREGPKKLVNGVPNVAYGGQGGLGDVVLHPNFKTNRMVYISYAVSEDGKNGAVVSRATLKQDAKLENLQIIWQQSPKVSGRGHYSHRMAFGPTGSSHEGKIFITSGERQKQEPAQDMKSSLGKIIRLNDDGSIPKDNPWADGSKGELAKTFWSVGHRNMLGIAFDANGELWSHEMGPRHGDELNLIKPGKNYGWPIVSEGNHYSGWPIPSHTKRPEFEPPKTFWVPTIAPSGLVIHSGKSHPEFKGNAFIGGLRSRAVIRVKLQGENTTEIERFEWGKRIREVEEGPQGHLWFLEDQEGGRLLRLK